MQNILLEHALKYAAQGWPVFPCRADKTPYNISGVLESSTNPQTIENWWRNWPNANIAMDVGGAGMMVIDLDPGHSIDQLEENIGRLPSTGLIQDTPRGGQHLFYTLGEDEIVPQSSSKLSPHVDVRSFHSYVLLHPSKTSDGVYTWGGQDKPAFRSDRMVEACLARTASEDRDNWIIDPDLPENIASAVKWLEDDAKLAIEGQGGDAMTYATAAHLKSFGISEELALDLIWDHWNERCSPPWEIEDLEIKVKNGYSYNTSPPGNITDGYREALNKQFFKPVEVSAEAGPEIHSGRFRFISRDNMERIKNPEMLIDDFLPTEAYALIVGAPGTFKTFVALDIALSIATGAGFPWDGPWPVINNSGPVLFCAGEGRANINLRVRAWEERHYDGNKVQNFVLADPVPFIGENIEPFIEGARALNENYKLVVVDTVSRAMQGVNENAQEHASNFTRMAESIQRGLGATVLGLHHTGHGETSRARGSSVFGADADTIIKLDRKPGKRLISLTMLKQKDLAQWEKKKWMKLDTVPLGDDIDSLACVSVEHEPQGEIDSSAIISIIDASVNAKLASIPGRSWTTKSLAEALAAQEDMGVGSSMLRQRYLRLIREDSECKSAKHYDADTAKWRFKS